jgi:GNAT superfamily N-acetyltransferase
MLYVAQHHRRHGIGRALMQALAARCDAPKLFTSTNQSNRPMQQLVEGLGYIPSGVIHNLDPGDSELVYMLDLRGGAA